MTSLGIDIGGTKIAAGLVSPTGQILELRRAETPDRPDALLDVVASLARRVGMGSVSAVGVAAAGYVDTVAGIVRHAPNIAWRNEPLKAALESRLQVPVTLDNDANAAGWAEYRFGAARAVSDVVTITVGTGVGGAVIADGVLIRGSSGGGGELGHLLYERSGRPCGCGKRGCLEQYGSGRALQREALDIAASQREGGALAAAIRDRTISGSDIAELVAAGDIGAVNAVRRIATALGESCASFHAMLDPAMIVVGGGVASLGDALLAPMREAYNETMLHHPNAGRVDFVAAELGNDAGVIGAADQATQAFGQ